MCLVSENKVLLKTLKQKKPPNTEAVAWVDGKVFFYYLSLKAKINHCVEKKNCSKFNDKRVIN